MQYKIILTVILLLGLSAQAEITWKYLWDGTYDENAQQNKFPGMTIMGNHSQWTLDEEAIRGDMTGGPYTMVWSNDVYTDATYEGTYKVDNGNGGMHFRARPDGTEPDDVDDGTDLVTGGTSAQGNHIEVDHRDAGCIYCSNCGGWKAHVPGEEAYNSLQGDKSGWINLRVLMNGRNIKTWIKDDGETEWVAGVDYNVGTHADMQKGRFGLQMHTAGSGLFWYKDLRLMEGCSDETSKYYDAAHVVDSGFVLLDNGSCLAENHGCKDEAFQEYNADAPFEDADLCVTPVDTRVEFVSPGSANFTARGGVLKIFGPVGDYEVSIYDVEGSRVFDFKGTGEKEFSTAGLLPGIYFVRLLERGKRESVLRVNNF